MAFAPSDAAESAPLTPFKILIAGGFGAGKTTLVGAISEIRPLRTEEALTQASTSVDDLGAVVLADTRRLGDSFPSVDYFERRQVPFIVAINAFDGAPRYDPEDVRVALDLEPYVPALTCDARERESVKEVLITLVEHVLTSDSAADSGSLSDLGETDEPGAVSSAR